MNDAERGTVNEAAVQNAVAVMKPFGMNNTLGEDMRRAVTSDMASLVDKVSDLIDRAHQGEDVVREWQDAVDGPYGIGNDWHECFTIDTDAAVAAPAVRFYAGGVHYWQLRAQTVPMGCMSRLAGGQSKSAAYSFARCSRSPGMWCNNSSRPALNPSRKMWTSCKRSGKITSNKGLHLMTPDNSSSTLQEELKALRGTDAILDSLLQDGPVTRESYLAFNFPDGVPNPMPGELEANLPRPLQNHEPLSTSTKVPPATSRLPAAPTRDQFHSQNEFE